MQYIYEFSSFCTSVIVRDNNNTIIHNRNIEFVFPDKMRAVTYEAIFEKDGKELYKAVMFSGLNGVVSGQAKGWAITLNQRSTSDFSNYFNLLSNLGNLISRTTEVTHVIRQTLEKCEDYKCAFKMLSKADQSAAAYFTISGIDKNEGAVISKDPNGVAHVDQLSEEKWYLVQTNDDHWKGICKPRCSYVRSSLDAIGKANISDVKLVEVLSKWPSIHSHSIYNVLFLNKKQYLDTKFTQSDIPSPD
jgi:hypothetical protein